ncbi:MAG: hypothetical protein AAFV47_07015 [Pseudomonadota bacterium]
MTVASVEIETSSILLPGINQSLTLEARVVNPDGDQLGTNVNWASSDPNVLSITSQSGQQVTITSVSSAGTAQIFAQAGGVEAAPIDVLVATTAPNSTVLSDTDIQSELTPVDVNADPGPGFRYEVNLANVSVAVGDVLLHTGADAFGGRVVAVTASGNRTVVTLETVTVPELFTEIVVSETDPVTPTEDDISQEIRDLYDIEQLPDGEIIFTLKPASAPIRTGEATRTIGPFVCEGGSEEQGNQVRLDVLPTAFTLKSDLNLKYDYNSSLGGLQELTLNGPIEAQFAIEPQIPAQFDANLDCAATLATLSFPALPAPLGLLARLSIPLKVGFEIGGTIGLDEPIGTKIGPKVTSTLSVGYKCSSSADCGTVFDFDTSSDADFDFLFPNLFALDEALRIEPKFSGYFGTGFDFEIGFFKTLKLDALEGKAGIQLTANLATIDGQIADDEYESDYKISAVLSGKLGPGGTEFIRLLEEYVFFSSVSVNPIELNIEAELLRSPSAKPGGLGTNATDFSVGQEVTFLVNLDPETVEFVAPGRRDALVLYNVRDVVIYEAEDDGLFSISSREIARTTASDGQTEFTLTWQADKNGQIGSSFYAFVETRSLPIRYFGELELGEIRSGSNVLAYQEIRDQIRGIDGGLVSSFPDGSDRRVVIPFSDDTTVQTYPKWSPTGSKIAFLEISSDSGGLFDLYSVNADGSDLTLLARDVNEGSFDWSPDGTRIVYSGWIDRETLQVSLFTVSADGSFRRRLTDSEWRDLAPRWSSDGSLIVFNRLRTQNFEDEGFGRLSGSYIYTISPNNPGSEFEVTEDLNLENREREPDQGRDDFYPQRGDLFPVWSPVSDQIAFVCTGTEYGTEFPDRSDYRGEICVIDANGENLRRLTPNVTLTDSGVSNSAPRLSWFPDGRSILAAVAIDSSLADSLLRVFVDGSGLAQIPTSAPIGGSIVGRTQLRSWPTSMISPDGTQIASSVDDRTLDGTGIAARVVVIDTAGETLFEIDNALYPAWRPTPLPSAE